MVLRITSVVPENALVAADGSLLATPAARALAGPGSPPLLPNGQPALLEDESMVNIAQIEGEMRASSLRRITDLVDKHPEETLSILRGWMMQEAG